jgi:Zn-dependent peptidase ImmA (M78 family)/DNA-binding XRE family transcriptional regulator
VLDKPNPSRLTLARKRRGLTKVALERRVGITAKSLGDFEKGRAVPSIDALEQIASVLRFPVSFFYRPDLEEPPVDSASFRSLSTMTAAQRDAALAAGALAFELSQWIDAEFELEAVDVPDMREHDPAEAAMMLRNYWGIGVLSISNMVHLLESKGIRVFSLAERGRQIDAFSLWFNDVPFVFLNTMKTVEHSRMDAAHELGHLVMHRHGAVRSRDVEKDAKAFAAAFLMPEASIIGTVPRLVGPTFNQLAQLKRQWGVSMSALAMRLNQLGLLPDWSYRGICIELSKFGRTREPDGVAERETSAVLDKVFTMLKESGTTTADVAKKLDLYTEDLEALIFGLGRMYVAETGRPTTNYEAAQRRRQFKVYF